jgi:serine/threonine protein kinase
MKAMHEAKPPIVHRDLRSFNIFMSSFNPDDVVTAKVGDFGLSTAVPISLSDILATWQWLAPEVTEPNSRYDERSDIYSFGVVAYEVMSRILPFTEFDEFLQKTEQPLTDDQLNNPDLLKQLEGAGFEIRGSKAVREEFLVHKIRTAILNGLRPSMPPSTPRFVSQLVRLCWSATPEERPPFSEIVRLFSTKLGLEDPPVLRKKTGAIKLVDNTKRPSSKMLKMEDFKDDSDFKIKKGYGIAIHDKLVTIKKEIKDKRKAKEAAHVSKDKDKEKESKDKDKEKEKEKDKEREKEK